MAIAAGIVLAGAGLLDVVFRCVTLGPVDGLYAAAQDPGKVVFHVLLLPLAAAELVRSFPAALVANPRGGAAFVGLTLVGVLLAALLTYDDAANDFSSRVLMPAAVADPAVRQDLQGLRRCFRGADAEQRDDALCRGDSAALYKARLQSFREGAGGMFQATTVVFAWGMVLSFLGAAFVAAVFVIIVTLLLLRRRPEPRLYHSLIAIVLLCATWLPLRAYSEWYINFGAFRIETYPIMVPAIVLAVFAIALLWMAQHRTRRARQVVVGIVSAVPVVVSVLAAVQPDWFSAAAAAIHTMSLAQFAAVYVILVLAVVAAYRYVVAGEGAGEAPAP